MTKKVIQTEQAPKAIGPYSQGVAYTGETIVVSGQLPIVPETGEPAGSDIASQTHQPSKNIRAILFTVNLTAWKCPNQKARICSLSTVPSF